MTSSLDQSNWAQKMSAGPSYCLLFLKGVTIVKLLLCLLTQHDLLENLKNSPFQYLKWRIHQTDPALLWLVYFDIGVYI